MKLKKKKAAKNPQIPIIYYVNDHIQNLRNQRIESKKVKNNNSVWHDYVNMTQNTLKAKIITRHNEEKIFRLLEICNNCSFTDIMTS